MSKKMFFKSIRNLFILLICGILMLPAEVFAAQTDTESTVLQLSEEEQAYRDRAGEIIIGCPVNNCPMLFKNEKTGEPEGIIIDVLDMVSETTGLTFRYQALPSGSITYEDLQRLNVDIVAGVESNETNEQAVGIVLTDSYLHAAKVFVCKKGTEFHPGRRNDHRRQLRLADA